MKINSKDKSRIDKLYELHLRGDGGEKENATKFLTKILNRYNLTIEDLSVLEEDTKRYVFKLYNDEAEEIFFGVCRKILNKNTINYFKRHRAKTRIEIDLTPSQHAKIESVYNHYMDEYWKEVRAMCQAYIQTNKLTAENPTDASEEVEISMTQEDWEEWERVQEYMNSMKEKPMHYGLLEVL